ncbi:hypothetical protein [Lacticaseibacillus nasuensis]|uniref:hypothetical protein n=1 Tax=Lacticaseibacillus nasuensis TaxID=944671 RepID=UPI002247A24F|nr:hypothetical protein [Lacticaseibacillus nasuensis]MCX2455665.1 hypothetical protein [Lacticaseibacillus nasuensis]
MDKPSRREHELALAVASALAPSEIQIERDKDKLFDPRVATEIVDVAYQQALNYFVGKYPD